VNPAPNKGLKLTESRTQEMENENEREKKLRANRYTASQLFLTMNADRLWVRKEGTEVPAAVKSKERRIKEKVKVNKIRGYDRPIKTNTRTIRINTRRTHPEASIIHHRSFELEG
jgi:hypothetical protein